MELLTRVRLIGLDVELRDEDGCTPIKSFETIRSRSVIEDSETGSRARIYFEEILQNATSEYNDLDRQGLDDEGKVAVSDDEESVVTLDEDGQATALYPLSEPARTEENEFFDALSSFGDQDDG